MADFDFDNPTFDPEDVDDDDVTTSFIDDNGGASADFVAETTGTKVGSLQQELLQTAVDGYYNIMAQEGHTPTLGRDYSKFELTVDGRLRLKAYPGIEIINARSGKALALSTVAARRGGGSAIRDDLGFTEFRRNEQQLPAKAVTALQTANNELGGVAADVDKVELQDLGQTAKEASDVVHKIVETTFTEIDEPLDDRQEPRLNLRELRGLDKAMQTIRGELTNNLAKLSELDDHIALEKRKLAETDHSHADEFNRRHIAERLRNLEDERASRLEAAASNREALRSQINRIRESINKILNEDTTLAERIRTLFREHGITIASILTAIGMAISTLVLALTGGGVVVPTPTPTPAPSNKDGLREWVKKHLQALGRALAKLAGKAAAALPGIIGSLVSWLLNQLGNAAGWLAGNLWAVILAVGGLLLVAARGWLDPSR